VLGGLGGRDWCGVGWGGEQRQRGKSDHGVSPFAGERRRSAALRHAGGYTGPSTVSFASFLPQRRHLRRGARWVRLLPVLAHPPDELRASVPCTRSRCSIIPRMICARDPRPRVQCSPCPRHDCALRRPRRAAVGALDLQGAAEADEIAGRGDMLIGHS
jgi:hypothetical protein